LEAFVTETSAQQQNDSLLAFNHENSTKQLEAWETLETRDKNAQEHGKHQLLVVSPYTTRSHLLDLDSIPLTCVHLARALTVMRATRKDYATAGYTESFNWNKVIEHLKRLIEKDDACQWQDQQFYIVVFRSQIPPSTDRPHLGALDELSHAEAMESGGLLKYWFGIPDHTGRNLATCVWRAIDDSKRGSAGKGHRQAAKEARALYTEWKIERLRLKIGPGAKTWEIVEWED
jgi:hypothetical protein